MIWFVRHGETVWNVENKICGATDSPLTERGHQQACIRRKWCYLRILLFADAG
jgi:broad specificity phosphatase PhoE